MPVTDGNVLKVVVSIDAPDSVECLNVYWYQLSDPTPDNPTDAQIISALDAEMTTVYEGWDDEMASTYTVDTMSVDRMAWNATDLIWEVVEHIGESLLDIDGLGISDAVPHGVAAVITFPTDDPKRRGRKFFPGMAEDGVTSSTLIGAVQTVLAAIGTAIINDVNVLGSAELIAGIASDYGQFIPLALAVVNTIAGYQRRRKPGVGT
jgi:hypothetical protein